MLISSTNLSPYLKLVEKFLCILIKNYYADGITNIQPE